MTIVSIKDSTKNILVMLLLSIGVVLLFIKAMNTFFIIDDFWWLYDGKFFMSKISGWLNAFLTVNGSGQYRPLSQNVFFWIGWHLFGFNPYGYHLLELIAFIATIVFAYFTYKKIFKRFLPALVASSIFAFSTTHYTAMAWVSAFSETGAALAFIISIYFFINKKYMLSTLFYSVALLCNETTTPLPAIALMIGIVVHKDTILESVKNTWSLWVVFFLYICFRLFIAGLPIEHNGPFAINTNPLRYLNLIYNSLISCIGLHPVFNNALRESSSIGVFSRMILFVFLGTLAISLTVSIIDKNKSKFLQTGLLGLLWFFVALSPMLLFSANNWSLYNLEIPLLGFSITIGSFFTTRNAVYCYIGAILVILSYFVISVITIYKPYGLNDIDSARILSKETKPLYEDILFLVHNRKKPLLINIVAKKNLENVRDIAGYNYGIAVVSNSLSNAHIIYSNKPVKNSSMVFIKWEKNKFVMVR